MPGWSRRITVGGLGALLGWSLTPATACADARRPGARFAPEARTGTATVSAAPVVALGSIARGRLNVDTGSVQHVLSFLLSVNRERDLVLDILWPRLRVDLGPDGGAAGNFGGVLSPSDLHGQLAALEPRVCELHVQGESVCASFVHNLADVPLRGGCGPRGAISVGFGFSLARVTLDPMPRQGPVPGMCGASAR